MFRFEAVKVNVTLRCNSLRLARWLHFEQIPCKMFTGALADHAKTTIWLRLPMQRTAAVRDCLGSRNNAAKTPMYLSSPGVAPATSAQDLHVGIRLRDARGIAFLPLPVNSRNPVIHFSKSARPPEPDASCFLPAHPERELGLFLHLETAASLAS